MATVQKFQDLEIWQLSRQLENDIFSISKEEEEMNLFSF
jgi:hypothetical protein